MSRLGAKVRRGTSSVRSISREQLEVERAWLRELDAADREQTWRAGPPFAPALLNAVVLTAWAVVVAIAVVGAVAVVDRDVRPQNRRPTGFNAFVEAP